MPCRGTSDCGGSGVSSRPSGGKVALLRAELREAKLGNLKLQGEMEQLRWEIFQLRELLRECREGTQRHGGAGQWPDGRESDRSPLGGKDR